MLKKLNDCYILVTPVKNEENYLPKLIKSITNQTIKPKLWVIVDDKSTDQTSDIIRKAKEENNWIQSIQLEESVRDRGIHLAKVIKSGFEFAYKYCENNKIEFNYIGNADADVTFENTYFEKLLRKFELNANLGIASGEIWYVGNGKEIFLENRYPDGGDVLYRKNCFEECGRIPISVLWDSVLNTKALLRGWKIGRFCESRAFITRKYCHADKLWKEYKRMGESQYLVNYNFVYALLKGTQLSFKKPYYLGLAYLNGYLWNFLLRREQINDKEVKNYFWRIRPQEINKYYIHWLNNKIKRKIL
jgi:glycosyltransferase involved in cell wall biosynthesis